MKKYYLLISTIPLFLFCHCKKNNETPIEQLPPITMSGENTFGCLINGEAWLPSAKGLITKELDVIVDELNDTFSLGAIKEDEFESFLLDMENVTEGIFDFSSFEEIPAVFFTGDCGKYLLDTLIHRELKISKYDKINKIISGEFSFTAVSDSCNDTIIVTNGRFDATYRF